MTTTYWGLLKQPDKQKLANPLPRSRDSCRQLEPRAYFYPLSEFSLEGFADVHSHSRMLPRYPDLTLSGAERCFSTFWSNDIRLQDGRYVFLPLGPSGLAREPGMNWPCSLRITKGLGSSTAPSC